MMTNATLAAEPAKTAPVDTLALALAARRARDAYVTVLLARAARRMFAGLGAWLRKRRSMAELAQLDPRLMADIGLDRGAFAAGVIRRIDADRAQVMATATLAPVARPTARGGAEPHLAPAVTPAAANDSRWAA